MLHHFIGGSSDSYGPTAPLVEGPDGALYGATLTTASPACGIVFKLNPDGSGYQVLRQCLYSTRVWRLGNAVFGTTWDEFFKLTEANPGYTIVRRFRLDGGDGYWPTHLFEGRDGVLYGTTYGGGTVDGGTVFRMNKDGTGYLLLRSFNNPNRSPDVPFGLIEGTDGLLYGSTRGGGTSYSGTIFKMNKDGGEFATLFNFDPGIGREPRQIIEGSDGALYGTTRGDGSRCGTIFRINKDGTGHTILHRLGIDIDNDCYALASVFEGSDGWLYGVSTDDGYETGQIYRLRKDGSGYTEVYTGPAYTLPIEAFDGTLYGTTTSGGANDAGIVFNIRKDGSGFKKLLDFPVSEAPLTTIMLASDQVLYGVTYATTSTTIGTLFKLNRDGSKYSVLHTFNDATGDGSAPRTPIFEGSDGALYGTTIVGGAMHLGTIFRLVPSPEVTLVRNHASNEVQITARALSGNTLAVEVSTDLKSWIQIASGTVTNGLFTADDPEGHHPSRFYRARLH